MSEYPIGTPGQAWGDAERAAWLAQQTVQRSYPVDVLRPLDKLRTVFDVDQYGTLDYMVGRFPLMALRSRGWDASKPTVLITGGVHGYETSGVHGALRFAATAAQDFVDDFNLAIAPCVSPWAYETINRWNPDAIDPNRSFVSNSPADECAALMRWVAGLGAPIQVHFDLHETTDTDNSEFRPAKAARDGVDPAPWSEIPDGFYLVGRVDRPVPDFLAAVRDAVAAVTHIAPADDSGNIIGVPLEQPGIINYDAVALGLCMGLTGAAFATTTEVYPDSPLVTDEICAQAQVAAVSGGLRFVRARQ
ncbi:MAG: M14 family metallocarboxypeptidase [Myxococcota bacterium]